MLYTQVMSRRCMQAPGTHKIESSYAMALEQQSYTKGSKPMTCNSFQETLDIKVILWIVDKRIDVSMHAIQSPQHMYHVCGVRGSTLSLVMIQ